MARGYRQRDEVELAWEANRVRADTELRLILARVRNSVMGQLDVAFKDGLDHGVVLGVTHTRDELVALVAETVATLRPTEPRIAGAKQSR